MSSKKVKKYGNINIAAQSLSPPDKEGYMTKQGGSFKSWKKRYFILKDRMLYYYKTPKDNSFTGKIDLESNSVVKEDPARKKPNLIAITTSNRIFFMYPEKPEEMKEWIDAISKGIEKAKLNGPAPSSPSPTQASAGSSTSDTPQRYDNASNPTASGTNSSAPTGGSSPAIPPGEVTPRTRLNLAKGVVPFLRDPESKVLEFWQIWSESIPSKEDLTSGMVIEFVVATSADMQKLTWRTSGPQNVFIQKMVDFFWNVGAPESEIDRLNDVGALINPVKIGSWIDMSAKGGMDGGWFFPVDIPLKLAIEASDTGDAVKKFTEWAEKHEINSVFQVGRDMGAAPPRQTEIKLKVPGHDFQEQLKVGLDAFSAFGFPAIPDDALAVLRDSKPEGLLLSVITSSEGFVRLGLLAPKPTTQAVLTLCTIAGGNKDDLASFEASLGTDGPSFVEYQYLMKSFGYGVYKEGFDIVFHYSVGDERFD